MLEVIRFHMKLERKKSLSMNFLFSLGGGEIDLSYFYPSIPYRDIFTNFSILSETLIIISDLPQAESGRYL